MARRAPRPRGDALDAGSGRLPGLDAVSVLAKGGRAWGGLLHCSVYRLVSFLSSHLFGLLFSLSLLPHAYHRLWSRISLHHQHVSPTTMSRVSSPPHSNDCGGAVCTDSRSLTNWFTSSTKSAYPCYTYLYHVYCCIDTCILGTVHRRPFTKGLLSYTYLLSTRNCTV